MGPALLNGRTQTAVFAKPLVAACGAPAGGEPSALRMLRRKKGLSLRRMADKMGIEKTRLLRLERKPLEKISLGDLELFALGLGIRRDELFRYWRGSRQQRMVRADRKSPFFVIEKAGGVKWASLAPESSPYFIGSLTLPPKASIASHELPRSSFIFCMVLEGQLLISLGPEEHFFRENEFFYLEDPHGELYNPHQLYPVTALCIALRLPSAG